MVSFTPRTIYPRGKSTVYPSNRRKISWPYRELNHDFLDVQPAAESPWLLRSPGSTHNVVYDVISFVGYAKTREMNEHLKILRLLITLGQILDIQMQIFSDVTPCWRVELTDLSKRRLNNHHSTQSGVPWYLNLQQHRCNNLKSHKSSRHAATTAVLYVNFSCGRDVSRLLRDVRPLKFTNVSHRLVGSIIWIPYHVFFFAPKRWDRQDDPKRR